MQFQYSLYIVLSVCIISLGLFTRCGTSSTDERGPASGSGQPECHSLLGDPLYPPEETPESYRRKDSLLNIAYSNYKEDPENLDNIIWYGRRQAYLSRYRKAIEIYTRGLENFPNSPELFRHRGHRYISIRNFDLAIEDLKNAAKLLKDRPLQIEPDGIPNKLNIPLSSLQFNVWYHLGLAHYLKGENSEAISAFEECMKYSVNPDLLCATTDWLFMLYHRAGIAGKAGEILERIQSEMKVIENEAYFKRLLMYKGDISPDDLLSFDDISTETELNVITQGYGVANWYLIHGDTAKARKILERIVETQYWPAFGYIAAEADLAGMQ